MTRKHNVNWYPLLFSLESFERLKKLLSNGFHATKARIGKPDKQDLPTKVRSQVSGGSILPAPDNTQKDLLSGFVLVGREDVFVGRAIEFVDVPLAYKVISRQLLRSRSQAGMLYQQNLNSIFLAYFDCIKLVSIESFRFRLGLKTHIANYQYLQNKTSISCLRENNDER